MGVADRVRRFQTEQRIRRGQQGEESLTDSQSIAVALVEPEHIKRLKGVVRVLENFIRTNDDGMYGRLAFFMSTVTDELAEELGELDELQVRLFMFQIGEVISWIGHGDNSRLPDTVREFAEMVQPSANLDTEQGSHIGTSSETG